MHTNTTNQRFHFPATGIAVEKAVLLAIDDYSLPFRQNVCYYMTRPEIWREPVIEPDKNDPTRPDHVGGHFYGSVIHDGGKFRMWYYGLHLGDKWLGGKFDVGKLRSGPVGYAESDDGFHWTKPNLGQVEFAGSRQNNAIALTGRQTFGVAVIKDEDDPEPQRRYKLIYQRLAPEEGRGVKNSFPTATSPDGLHWTVQESIATASGIETASLYKFNGLYVLSGQMWPRGEGGHARGREGFVVVSPDFQTWVRAACEAFALPEPANPEDCGNEKPYDQVHLGVGATNFGNVAVGYYTRWHNQPTGSDWFGIGRTYGDLGLVVSNDGLHFREPIKGRVWIDRHDSPPNTTPISNTETILCQGNGILNVGDTTYIYHGRWANTANIEEYYAEVGLATLPRDRYGALGLYPDKSEGEIWSTPLTLPQGGGQITLNADGVSGMRVDLADERFFPLAGYSGESSGAVPSQTGLEGQVVWPAGSLAPLGGQTVRLRVQLNKQESVAPRLYAVYLHP